MTRSPPARNRSSCEKVCPPHNSNIHESKNVQNGPKAAKTVQTHLRVFNNNKKYKHFLCLLNKMTVALNKTTFSETVSQKRLEKYRLCTFSAHRATQQNAGTGMAASAVAESATLEQYQTETAAASEVQSEQRLGAH